MNKTLSLAALIALSLVTSSKNGISSDVKPFYLPLDEVIPKAMQKQTQQTKRNRTQGSALLADDLIDYSVFDSPVVNQYRGDCTAQAMGSAMDNVIKRTDASLETSQESFWNRYEEPSVFAAVKASTDFYIKTEYGWPFAWKTWRQPEEKSRFKVQKIVSHGNDANSLYEAMKQGAVGYWGGSVSQDMASCFKEISGTSKPTNGGHSVALVGARVKNGKLSFKVKQSWGPKCGDKGYQWLDVGSCDQPGSYCYFWSVWSVEDSAKKVVYKAEKPSLPDPTHTPKLGETTSFLIDGLEYSCKRVK